MPSKGLFLCLFCRMKIGDFVKFIDEPGGGVLRRIDTDGYWIMDEHGFEECYQLSELIKNEKVNYHTTIPHSEGQEKDPEQKKSQKASKRFKEKLEVDLHLHHLIDNDRGLDNYQKIQIQKRAAQDALNRARLGGYKYCVLIHGKGSGKLRTELWNWLSHQKVVDFYDMDISIGKSGITEVQLF